MILHGRTDATTLGLVRMWVFGMCLGDVLREPMHEFLYVPVEFLTRTGPLALLPESWFVAIYTPDGLAVMRIVLALLLAACVAGVPRFRAFAIPACIVLTIHHSVTRSVGHVNHGELAMLYAAYVLAVFPSADAVSLRSLIAWFRAGRPSVAREEPGRSDSIYATAMVFIAFLFLITYTFTGAYRTAMNGPQVFFDGTPVKLVLEAALKPGTLGEGFGDEMLSTQAGRVAMTLGFAGVTVLELLAPLCLFSRPFRVVWSLSIVVFHILSWLLLQVIFFHNLVLMPILMVDLQPAVQWVIALMPEKLRSLLRYSAPAAPA